jgi:hypothetical protein
LKSIDNNLNLQSHHFWKYISNFRQYRYGFVQLEVDGTQLVQPNAVADAFAKDFLSVYNNRCFIDFPLLSQHSEFVSLTLLPMRVSVKPLRD